MVRSFGRRVVGRLLRLPILNQMIAEAIARNPELYYEMTKRKTVRAAALEQRGFIEALFDHPDFTRAYQDRLAKAVLEHPALQDHIVQTALVRPGQAALMLDSLLGHLPDVEPGSSNEPGEHDSRFRKLGAWIHRSPKRSAYFLEGILNKKSALATHVIRQNAMLSVPERPSATKGGPGGRQARGSEVLETWQLLLSTVAQGDIDLEAARAYLESRAVGQVKINDLAAAALKSKFVQIYGNTFQYLDSTDLITILEEIVWREEYWFASDKENPVIIDCGSNIGLSIIYFKKHYPGARITAFEPVEALRDICARNLAAQGIDDVDLQGVALAGVEGETTISVNENSLAAALVDRRPHLGDRVTASRTVKTRRLSQYLTGEVDYLKMDIEGSEFEVLVEAQGKLNLVRKMFCEYHLDSPEAERNLPELLAILMRAGMRYSIVDSPWAQGRNSYRPGNSIQKPTSLSIFAERV